jgi:pimeloyl-ACP methyl ester carboxylesterase
MEIERPALAGHSWGAGVALAYAGARPGAVSGLALIDGGVVNMGAMGSWDEMAPRMQPPKVDGTPVETFVGFMRRWPPLEGLWNDELGEMVLSNFHVREGKVYRALTIPDHMKIARAIHGFDPAPLIRGLDCPLLVISCHQEPANEEGRQWQAARREALANLEDIRPEARVVVMEDTIHDVPIQRPRELATHLLEFLADH